MIRYFANDADYLFFIGDCSLYFLKKLLVAVAANVLKYVTKNDSNGFIKSHLHFSYLNYKVFGMRVEKDRASFCTVTFPTHSNKYNVH